MSRVVSGAPPTGFQTTQIIGGLNSPTAFAFAPDGRLFITELAGVIKVYKNGQVLSAPFAELQVTASGDRGLLGIAFDPDFSNGSPYVYLYYTGVDEFNRIARLNASQDIANGPPQIIYQSYSPSEWLHVGGALGFGPDGKLYVSIGDNGYPPNAQDLSFANHFGKVLRLNRDGTVPTDNPFYGRYDVAPEIWAWGLRNPFRFQFDSATGNLYLGDVGNKTWEEINLIERGKNYGWPTCEGPCSEAGMTNPSYSYNRAGIDGSIMAGPVYRGNAFPTNFQGKLFFGDYAAGFIKTLDLSASQAQNFDLDSGTVIDIKEGPDGAIYYLTIFPGALYKVTNSQSGNQPPLVSAASNVTQGPAPLSVNFSSMGTSDPEGDPLTYNWNFGDGTLSSEANPTKIYNTNGSFSAQLSVSDGTNFAVSDPILIQVGTPPTVTITSPTNGSSYQGGSKIFYSAVATDSLGNPLPDSAFTLEVIFHHGSHIHPFLGPINSRQGNFNIPESGHEDATNVWYEIKITGVDSEGLSTTQSVNIYPETANVTINTSPTGFNLILDGTSFATPLTFSGVVGMKRELSVPVLQKLGGTIYNFVNWSSGRSVKHIVQIPTVDTTYTANFSPAPAFTGEYFNNQNLSGAPTLIRNDPEINFVWSYGSPDPSIDGETFSTRWTKTQFFAEGLYRFTTTTDDGVRLYIDNVLVIDEWHDQSSVVHTTDVDLSQGDHEIKMEYFENSGVAVAKLSWDLSPNQVAEPVPLTPAPTEYWQGEYWNTPGSSSQPAIPITVPNLSRNDNDIYFDWSWGSPDPIISGDRFVSRWTRSIIFESATYRITTTSDDGIRVYLDGNLVHDFWVDQPPTTHTTDVPVSAGSHTVVVEFYENTGTAVSQVTIDKLETQANGNGLLATYFDNIDLSGASVQRIDQQVSFDWFWGSPHPSIGADTFSTRWTGQILPAYSETYTFYTTTDDGVRLWVNNQLIIDKWLDQSSTEWNGTINLTGGTLYDIKLEYFENGGVAKSVLSWSSTSQLKQVIPQARLFAPSSNLYTGEFWNTPGAGSQPNIPSTPPDLTRSDADINFDWDWGSPDPSISGDHFVVRWTKSESFIDGTYRFTTTSDDGIRVYLDGVLIHDWWIDQPSTTHSTDYVVVAGTHEIIIEFYENTGTAVANFSFVKL